MTEQAVGLHCLFVSPRPLRGGHEVADGDQVWIFRGDSLTPATMEELAWIQTHVPEVAAMIEVTAPLTTGEKEPKT